jgi:flavin-dependent dehydrogenase
LERFDAVIVGAGAAGLATATCAAARNARVLLLDCTHGSD